MARMTVSLSAAPRGHHSSETFDGHLLKARGDELANMPSDQPLARELVDGFGFAVDLEYHAVGGQDGNRLVRVLEERAVPRLGLLQPGERLGEAARDLLTETVTRRCIFRHERVLLQFQAERFNLGFEGGGRGSACSHGERRRQHLCRSRRDVLAEFAGAAWHGPVSRPGRGKIFGGGAK